MTLKVDNTSSVLTSEGSFPPASQDANAQAAYELGMLVFLARGYAAATDPAQKEAILEQYKKLLADFQANGGQITFNYNGNEKVSIVDPTIAKLIEGMESHSGIDKIAAWFDSATDSPVETILNWMRANKVDLHSDENPQTLLDFSMFMLAVANSKVADIGGLGEQFLEEGLNNGAPLSNIQVLAELLTQSGMNGKVIAACLQVPSQSDSFKELGAVFSKNYQAWQKDPSVLPSWKDISSYFSAFCPRAEGGPNTQAIHAPPASKRPSRGEEKNSALHDLSDSIGTPLKKQKV